MVIDIADIKRAVNRGEITFFYNDYKDAIYCKDNYTGTVLEMSNNKISETRDEKIKRYNKESQPYFMIESEKERKLMVARRDAFLKGLEESGKYHFDLINNKMSIDCPEIVEEIRKIASNYEAKITDPDTNNDDRFD